MVELGVLLSFDVIRSRLEVLLPLNCRIDEADFDFNTADV